MAKPDKPVAKSLSEAVRMDIEQLCEDVRVGCRCGHMRHQPDPADHIQGRGERLAGIDEHVASGLDRRVVIRAADLRRGWGRNKRHRPARVMYPLVPPRLATRGSLDQPPVPEAGICMPVAIEKQAALD